MFKVKTRVYSERITFQFAFNGAEPLPPELASRKLFVSFRPKGRQVSVSQFHDHVNMQYDSAQGASVDVAFGLLLGLAPLWGKAFFVMAEDVCKVGVYRRGEVFQVRRVTVLDANGADAAPEERALLEEFFDSFAGNLFFYVPFRVAQMVP